MVMLGTVKATSAQWAKLIEVWWDTGMSDGSYGMTPRANGLLEVWCTQGMINRYAIGNPEVMRRIMQLELRHV
jgi:hypothetical protein